MRKQSDIFLNSEGDNWFKRNPNIEHKPDMLLLEINKILIKKKNPKNINILEIGSSNGKRLSKIYHKFRCKCFGLEPSKLAIKNNVNKKVKIIRGTADKIKFSDKKFDIVIFGFCLYLIDIEDLFQVASEVDRLTKKGGLIIIWDFNSRILRKKNYKHDKRISTIKYDFYKIFTWHPHFKLKSRKKYNYLNKINFAVSVDVIRKN